VSQLLPKAKTLANADADARVAIKEKLRRLADHTQQAVLLSQGTGSRTQVELRAKVQINTVLPQECKYISTPCCRKIVKNRSHV